MDLERVPPQPPQTQWRFIEELTQNPVHRPLRWAPRPKRPDEADLRQGVRLDLSFPDPTGALQTAYADIRTFLHSVRLPEHPKGYPLSLVRGPTAVHEAHKLRVMGNRTELLADDTEGIRRGLVWIEDEMLRRGGPFLPLGTLRRKPVCRTRISRCFYGPINLPPRLQDELADQVDYYPDAYLDRLAHLGVNALWLTIYFFRTVPSRIIPQYGRQAGPRLDKLRRVVDKCARYGIKIYPFCIEPAGFARPDPELKAAAAAHPDLLGHGKAFCTSTPKGQAYLREATSTLFSQVPGLGGLIVISVGEAQTHCYSVTDNADTCPRCSQRKGHQVLAETLRHLRDGMHSVTPDAELVSWPYGQFVCWRPEKTIDAASRMPKGVILQHNFETGGHSLQLGKPRPMWDYWLSWIGPAQVFRRCARAAVKRSTRIFAKLQISCSHEICTTSVVPVPSMLYHKYLQMHRLGVSGAMLSWLTGAHPSLMARAAGELSFDPLPRDENEFLLSLARRDWGTDAPLVARAWRHFARSYQNYPAAHIFQYFGPMNDGIVWPLHLVPQRKPLSPFWQLCYPPSGDYLPMCITNGFTLTEILDLCRRMNAHWARGAAIMKRLLPAYRRNPERLRDIRISLALDLQIRSAHDILQFYALRERLAEAASATRRKDLLDRMENIMHRQITASRQMEKLTQAESLLGYESEAEGYKYYPELLRWRIRQLKRLLQTEFPQVRRRLSEPSALFPGYTGPDANSKSYSCARVARISTDPARMDRPPWKLLPAECCTHWLGAFFVRQRWQRCIYDGTEHVPMTKNQHRRRTTTWRACHDGKNLYVGVVCAAGSCANFDDNEIIISIEPQRTLPRLAFHFRPGRATCIRDDGYFEHKDNPWRDWQDIRPDHWSFILRVPLAWMRADSRGRMRINVERTVPTPGEQGLGRCSWAQLQPAQGRLCWGNLNPATDFGWLVLEKSMRRLV